MLKLLSATKAAAASPAMGWKRRAPQRETPCHAQNAEKRGERAQRILGCAGDILPPAEQGEISGHMHIALQQRDQFGQRARGVGGGDAFVIPERLFTKSVKADGARQQNHR